MNVTCNSSQMIMNHLVTMPSSYSTPAVALGSVCLYFLFARCIAPRMSGPIRSLSDCLFPILNHHEGLAYYAQRGDLERVRSYFAKGANVNFQNRKSGDTPLILACRNGHMNVVQFLLSNGANVQMTNQQGETFLHAAARAVGKNGMPLDKSSFSRAFIAYGKHVIDRQNCQGETALHVAVKFNPDIIPCFLKMNPTIDLPDRHGKTALHKAGETGDGFVVEVLERAGADCNRQDKAGNTVLHYAATTPGPAAAFLYLLKPGLSHKVNPNVFNQNGEAPIHALLSSVKRCTQKCLKIIQHNRYQVNLLGKKGTAAHLAASTGNMEVMTALVQKGADLTLEDPQGNTPLGIAVKNGNDSCVKTFKNPFGAQEG